MFRKLRLGPGQHRKASLLHGELLEVARGLATVQVERGLPVTLDGEDLDGVSIVKALNELAGRHGFGRGMHLGDTILGVKGRDPLAQKPLYLGLAKGLDHSLQESLTA